MKPPVFAALDLAEALAQSKAEAKLLFVAAVAEGNEGCKLMDQMTWSQEAVVAALADVAIAVRVDVEAQKEVGARLKVESTPTVVVFKDGVELDRLTGVMHHALFLEWLGGLVRGETEVQRLRRESEERPDDVESRLRLASQLSVESRHAEATTHYVWLWQHILDKAPALAGIHEVMSRAVAELIEKHPPARAPFIAIRDGGVPRLDALEAVSLASWLALNKALRDPSAGLAWYDANAAALAKTEGAVRKAVIGGVIPLLLEAERWADAGALYEDPLAEIGEALQMREAIRKDLASETPPSPEFAESLRVFADDHVAKVAGTLAKALRAAKRDDDANRVEAEARKHGIEAKP